MIKHKIIKDYQVLSLDEQETMISFDPIGKHWHLFTDYPPHAELWNQLVDNDRPTRRGYRDGKLAMLEGDISGMHATFFKDQK